MLGRVPGGRGNARKPPKRMRVQRDRVPRLCVLGRAADQHRRGARLWSNWPPSAGSAQRGLQGNVPDPIAGRVAGFKSEWWSTSNRNGGRLRLGIPGRLQSESANSSEPRVILALQLRLVLRPASLGADAGVAAVLVDEFGAGTSANSGCDVSGDAGSIEDHMLRNPLRISVIKKNKSWSIKLPERQHCAPVKEIF